MTEVESAGPTLYRFRKNLVVVASAGTGKTHALVGVLIHLALGACERDGSGPTEGQRGGLGDPVPLDRVVATTFSRKAAAEIRERLTRELARLVSLDPSAAYREDLLRACDRVGAPRFGDADLATRASRALDGIGGARIGTLHGLAATIVRGAGITRGRAASFDIEGEDDARDRAEEAASRALEELLREEPRGAASLAHLAGGVGVLVERAAELLGRLSEEGRGASELGLFDRDAVEIEEKLDALLQHASQLRDDGLLGPSASALCDAWASGDPDRLEETASSLCAVAARGRLGARAQAFFDFRAGLPGLTHGERGKNLVKTWKLRQHVIPQGERMKTLLVRAEAHLQASMARDSVLGYGEVLRTARDILEEGPARGFDALLEAFLVDEFQDTSRIQREIVELLWQDPAADPSLPRIARVRRRGLLVVGDRKQSIYGFRGADVASFAELCIGLAGRPARESLRVAPGRVWEPEEPIADFVALRHNRRSGPEILTFVNAYSKIRLVALTEPAELYEVEYAPAIEDLSSPDAPRPSPPDARVSWIRLPTVSARAGGTPPGTPGLTSSRASEADAVARRISKILRTGEPRVRGLAPAPMDIAVLAQRNGMLEATAYALARAGIPYVVAGHGFFSAREVKDMVAMLSLIVDPDDVLARATVLRGPWCGVSDETLIALTDPHAGLADVEAWAASERRAYVRPEDKPHLEALREVVLELRGAVAAIGPAETLRQAVRALSFEETLILLPRGEQRVANVRKVLALAEREPSARAFLTRMNRATDEERAEPEAATFSEAENAVRLLTVHASKGLDFPIVFLPEAGAVAGSLERSPIVLVNGADGSARIATRLRDDEGRLHDTPSFAAARRDGARREIAERARLAYVAATRAREAVVFVGNRRAPKGAGSDAYRSSSAAALARMAADEATAPLLRVDETPDEAATAFGQPREDRGDRGVFRAVEIPRHGTLALGASELDDFGVCPRRFHLKHLLEVPEPPFAPDRGAKTRQLSLTLVSSKAATAAAVVHARWTGSFDRAPIATCIAIACGYVGLCHPRFTR